jgi:hypothetical protein
MHDVVPNADHMSRLLTEEERKEIEDMTRSEPYPIVLHARLVPKS